MRLPPLLATLLFLAARTVATACEACVAPATRTLDGLVHGGRPDGPMDYVIVAVTLLFVAYATVAGLRAVARPSDTSRTHIKRLILEQD